MNIRYNRCVRCGASALLDEVLCPVCVDKYTAGTGPTEDKEEICR